MAKKEKAKKAKPLDKMTIKELKETALEIPDIVGVHGMNKSELLSIIKEHRGIADEGKAKAIDTRAIKKQIAALKETKAAVKEAGNPKKTNALRKKISKLKKMTRKAA